MKDLLFIAYAGMIRGAVAFGLVLRISHEIPNRSVIVTSSLALVSVTTVFMGSTVSTMQRVLFGDLSKTGNHEHHGSGHTHEISHHELFLHPNLEISINPAPVN